MIHEFEEIVFIRWWFRTNQSSLLERFPKLGERMINQLGSLSTEAFALIVAEEFILVSVTVVICAVTKNYNLFIGMVVAYTIHLIGHIVQTITIRKYTPFIVTSVLTGIYCILVLNHFITENLLITGLTVVYSVIYFIILVANLFIMQRLVKRIRILHGDGN